jgi:hypothetical protein
MYVSSGLSFAGLLASRGLNASDHDKQAEKR